MILQLRHSDNEDDHEEEAVVENIEEEIEAMLEEEFALKEEDEETENEETEEAATERLEMEIEERFVSDENNLTTVTVNKYLQTLFCHNFLIIELK